MTITKRNFLKASGAAIASLSFAQLAQATATKKAKPQQQGKLTDITTTVSAITAKERQQRIAKAQQLMGEHNIAAMIIEPGATMDYFSGIQWWRSERLTALVIPQQGEVAVVCPFFEEPSIRETLMVGNDVRVWQEHESPFIRIKQILKDRGIEKGNIAFEHSVRYFVLQGVMALLPAMKDVSASAVTWGCRMYKSPHELQLMHKANEVTLMAYQYVWSQLAVGMTQADVKSLMHSAQAQLGGSGIWNMALFNQASAYPHGTKQQQTLTQGSVVLMDCGCNVHGYQSDISRTFVFGEANKQQQKVWHTVRQGQNIAFDKAQLGVAAGAIDDAVRQYYQNQGYGPAYQLPGLSHRTGHGIGMKGHEGVNFVHGEETKLAQGMCFSNEPGIYLPGEFGVRLEDCLYFNAQGPQWFTEPPVSLDSPIGKLAKLKV
ncbi:metallopeptidase [Thalassotalea insulae]|uniref:Metallopeptidase n=1 Tax=Thalassotalea insulae TaxID=2056778 RepID=A0ABQ6GXJ8_9GAMM|nr:Xaa-Pro peptidase family protein [Thalassotalea insulae]GLX79337.1 metallopeptidase [Thalassotalea insulae]